jgi:hypothetical protein
VTLMLVSEPWPLEAMFFVVVIWSGMIGLLLVGVQALANGIPAYPLAGFFAVLTRTGFIAVLTVILWKQIVLLPFSGDWRQILLHLLLVLMFGFMILANAVILAERVFTDRYGAESSTATQ